MPWWRDGVWICMDDVWMMYGWHGQQRTDMGLFAIGSNGWMNLFTGNYYQLFVRLGCHRITRCSPGMRLILSHIWSLYREMCFFDLLKLPQLNWIMMVKFYTIGNPYRYAYILFFAVVVFFVEWKKNPSFPDMSRFSVDFPYMFNSSADHLRSSFIPPWSAPVPGAARPLKPKSGSGRCTAWTLGVGRLAERVGYRWIIPSGKWTWL
jgi:hypothetical protein